MYFHGLSILERCVIRDLNWKEILRQDTLMISITERLISFHLVQVDPENMACVILGKAAFWLNH